MVAPLLAGVDQLIVAEPDAAELEVMDGADGTATPAAPDGCMTKSAPSAVSMRTKPSLHIECNRRTRPPRRAGTVVHEKFIMPRPQAPRLCSSPHQYDLRHCAEERGNSSKF